MDAMSCHNAGSYLEQLFAKAGRPDNHPRTDEENLQFLSITGARRFKRRTLGLCGYSTVKSLDEVAGLLVETGIASSLSEGRELVPKIVEANRISALAIYTGGAEYLMPKCLTFTEVKNSEGDVMYRITSMFLAD